MTFDLMSNFYLRLFTLMLFHMIISEF